MISATNVQNLVERYKQAARDIDALTGTKVEAEVAPAALRTNATATLNHLSSRASGVGEAELAPLEKWVNNYHPGGTRAERVVGTIDKSATKVLKDVATWAFSGTAALYLIGIGLIISAAVGLIVDWGQVTGQATAIWVATGAALPAGAGYYLLNYGPRIVQGGANEVGATWASASSIGNQAMHVMEKTSLPTERDLRKAAGGAPHPGVPFVRGVRLRAQLVVGGAYGVAITGVLIFIIAAINAYNEYNANPPAPGMGF